MEEVKVVGTWASPYVYRVIWALKLKGIKCEYIEEDIFNKSDLILQLNPVHKKVPVFIHGGKPIAESIVILEHIDEVWPQIPLLPDDPSERAFSGFLMKFGDDKTTGEEQEQATEDAQDHLKILEEDGPGEKKFFGGNNIGMTDLAFGWLAFWLDFVGEAAGVKLLQPNSFPRLQAWIENFKNVAVIKENHPDRNRMLEHFKGLQKMYLSPTTA